MLDWGGALGQYALVARRLLPEVAFDYVVKEMPVNCRLAGELNSTVTFVDSDDACFSRSYDVVMANGSIHYVEDWKALTSRLATAARSWLLINCLPIVRRVPSYIVVQRLRSLGYEGEFYSAVMTAMNWSDTSRSAQGPVVLCRTCRPDTLCRAQRLCRLGELSHNDRAIASRRAPAEAPSHRRSGHGHIRRGLRNDWIGRPDYRNFLLALASRPGPLGNLTMFVLKLNGMPIAAQLNSVDRSRVESYTVVYDPVTIASRSGKS